ncbi:hypothetical protein [uncultured Draconibacterium sp.]|uniref:hypothetical protein n=1 Tax=uncultured Draconibacterium sp. TaxID=1573823 RepID=UPI0032171B19
MKTSAVLLLVALLFTYCNFSDKTRENAAQERTPEELWKEEKAKQDSIDNLVYDKMQKTAFGDFVFGMNKTQVAELNVEKEKLGKYNYSLSPRFTNQDELYQLTLKSSGVKAIKFESDLSGNYTNLFKIIETRYGAPLMQKKFPSVFDVQESNKYLMSKWEQGTKIIAISLVENNLNSYAVVCDIFDSNMSAAEKERLNKFKNKDITEAAEKF